METDTKTQAAAIELTAIDKVLMKYSKGLRDDDRIAVFALSEIMLQNFEGGKAPETMEGLAVWLEKSLADLAEIRFAAADEDGRNAIDDLYHNGTQVVAAIHGLSDDAKKTLDEEGQAGGYSTLIHSRACAHQAKWLPHDNTMAPTAEPV